MRSCCKGIRRLVEADVSVRSKSEKLKIDSAGPLNDLVVFTAGLSGIHIGAVRNMNVLRLYIDVTVKMLVHEIPVALLIVVRKALILIQIDGGNPGKINSPFLVALYQTLVQTLRRASGCKSEYTVLFHQNLRKDHIGSSLRHLFVILCHNNLHLSTLSFFLL